MTSQTLKLTSYSHGAGCACKLPLADLSRLLTLLGPHEASAQLGADVLVGLDAADDAAVIRVGDDAIVLTLDFFTPIVDDAFTWGRIAATNAASDVYAMGGWPIAALNIVAWPSRDIPLEVLAEVLRGGASVASGGGFLVLGGHSIDDPEPKYGMVVVGRADPARLMTMDGARPGDVLVLTKPIGTGVITTAVKRDAVPDDAYDAAVVSMTRLNDLAASALLAHGVRGCTDVTGFGLLGHLHRMLVASGASAELDASAVPVLPGVERLIAGGHVPGGTKRNLETVDPHVTWTDASETTRIVLADAQTSGGLLAACPPDEVDGLVADLETELESAVIGTVATGEPGAITVRGEVR